MDRFSSQEHVEWARGPFEDGMHAKIVAQKPLTACPSADTIGEFAAKSWRAGWADADASLASETHVPVAYRDHSDAWIGCSCGWEIFGANGEDWIEHVRARTKASSPASK